MSPRSREEAGLVLRLPWPPKELSPNTTSVQGRRGRRAMHWGDRSRAVAQYRSDCYLAAREAQGYPQRMTVPKTTVTAHVVFVVPDKRRRDLDNAMASMKPAWDGLVDAGVLVDDDSKHLRLAAPEMRVVKNERYVEVTLSHE